RAAVQRLARGLVASRAGVADRVHGGAHGDPAGDGDEQAAQRVDREPDPGQGQQVGQPRRPAVAGHGRQAGGDRGGAGGGGERPGGGGAGAARQGRRGGGEQSEGQGRAEGGAGQVRHRPVSPRSAPTIASGSGGQPGTSASTGTTSSTGPCTP